MSTLATRSFTAGELSPAMLARKDMDGYYAGLSRCENFVVKRTGGVEVRPGTLFVGAAHDSEHEVRLITFEFSNTQAYALELGENYMKVIYRGSYVTDALGSVLLVATPWLGSELFDLVYKQSGDVITVTHPSHPPYDIARVSATSWTVTATPVVGGPLQTVNTDTSIRVYFSAATGSVTVTASEAMFTADNVGQLFYAEQNDFGIPWEYNKAVSTGDIRWFNFKYYEALDTATTGGVSPNHDYGIASDGAVRWRYRHGVFGSGIITAVAVDGLSATLTVVEEIPASLISTAVGPITITAVSELIGGFIRATCTGHGLTASAGRAGVQISATVGGTLYDGDLTGVDIYVSDADHIDIQGTWTSFAPSPSTVYTEFTSGAAGDLDMTGASTHRWALGSWSPGRGYPSCVDYYEQRRVFAGTVADPQVVEASTTGGYNSFTVPFPITDSSPFSFKVDSGTLNRITGTLSMERLLLFSSGGVWAVSGGNDGALTYATPQIRLQTRRGSSKVHPLRVGDSAIYAQHKGGAVRDLLYEISSEKYMGSELSRHASHILEGVQIVDWCYQEIPFGCVWIVDDAGNLSSMTYVREEKVVGWARHPTDGTVESVCNVVEDNKDVVYLVVLREPIGGSPVRCIEMLADRLPEDPLLYVGSDAALVYDGRNTGTATFTLSSSTGFYTHEEVLDITASELALASMSAGDVLVFERGDYVYRVTLETIVDSSTATGRSDQDIPASLQNLPTSDWALARSTFTGASHLLGKEVDLLLDGDAAGYTVPVEGAGSFTLTEPAYVVVAGLPRPAYGTLPEASLPGGPALDLRAVRPLKVVLAVENCRGMSAGEEGERLVEMAPELSDGQGPLSLETGRVDFDVSGGYDFSGKVTFAQLNPLPGTVLSATVEYAFGEE